MEHRPPIVVPDPRPVQELAAYSFLSHNDELELPQDVDALAQYLLDTGEPELLAYAGYPEEQRSYARLLAADQLAARSAVASTARAEKAADSPPASRAGVSSEPLSLHWARTHDADALRDKLGTNPVIGSRQAEQLAATLPHMSIRNRLVAKAAVEAVLDLGVADAQLTEQLRSGWQQYADKCRQYLGARITAEALELSAPTEYNQA